MPIPTIIVNYNGNSLLVRNIVAEELHLRPGQHINDCQFWQVITGNAAAMVAELRELEAKGEKIPDVSHLERLLEK